MYTSSQASQLNFDNVISMGVSYSYEDITEDGKPISCEDKDPKERVKRTKNVTLEVLNLDLGNTDNSVTNFMAGNQSEYTQTTASRISANGVDVGLGKLVNYGIKEGGQSNAVITSLTYQMIDTTDKDEDDDDLPPDPIQRTDSVKVTKNDVDKVYTKVQTVGVTYPGDIDLITGDPRYSGNTQYNTADGRLALAEDYVNGNFGDSVPMEDYLGAIPVLGYDDSAAKENCYERLTNRSEQTDYINGNYSKSLTTTMRYTGKEGSSFQEDGYSVEYSMSFNGNADENESCTTATMKGRIVGASDIPEKNNKCDPSKNAKEGFDQFVIEGSGKQRLTEWYNALKSHMNIQNDLNDEMKNLRTHTCNPAVDKGEDENNGVIEFSFQMDNCPGEKRTEPDEEGNTYPYTESSTESSSYSEQKDCNGNTVQVTTSTSSKSVSAKSPCAKNLSENGDYELYNTIASVQPPADPPYNGDRGDDNKIQSETTTYNKYQGTKSWSKTFSDALTDEDCKNRQKDDDCYEFETSSETKEGVERTITQATAGGLQSITQGVEATTISVSVGMKIKEDCDLDEDELISKLEEELENNKPTCITTKKSWSLSVTKGETPSIQGNIAGIEEVGGTE